MSGNRRVEVTQRLAALENADTNRLLESTLRPLANIDGRASTNETISVPVDLLLTRFKNLDRAITTLNQKFQDQDDALRKKAAGDWFRVAVLIALTWGVTTGYSRIFGPSRPPAAQTIEAANVR